MRVKEKLKKKDKTDQSENSKISEKLTADEKADIKNPLWTTKAFEFFGNPLFVSKNIKMDRKQTVLNSKKPFQKVIVHDLEVNQNTQNNTTGVVIKESSKWYKLIEFYKYKNSVYPRKTKIYVKNHRKDNWKKINKQCVLPLFLNLTQGLNINLFCICLFDYVISCLFIFICT